MNGFAPSTAAALGTSRVCATLDHEPMLCMLAKLQFPVVLSMFADQRVAPRCRYHAFQWAYFSVSL